MKRAVEASSLQSTCFTYHMPFFFRTKIFALFQNFQASMKLKDIHQAEANRVSSEAVIRFAYQISKSHSVAAPLNWQLGEASRPYPTEVGF